jgi:hypothetical protein
MRFSITALFAFATAVMAQTEGFNVITKPVKGEQVPAGSTYQIVWQPSAAHPGEITIGLLGGASPQTLSVVDTIASKTCPCTWLKKNNVTNHACAQQRVSMVRMAPTAGACPLPWATWRPTAS